MKTKVFLITVFLCVIFTTNAQTISDTTLVQIETQDGNEFIGTVILEDSEKIILKTANFGDISILKSNVKSTKEVTVQQIKDGKLWFANPQSTRYFWSPNGYGLKKGEGYYQNIWVLWNQFAYGLTENFSIGGAIVPLFLFGGAPTPLFGTVKLSIPLDKEKINLAAGAIAGTVLGESESSFGILYGLSTFGSPDNNVSLGLGFGFGGGEIASTPVVNLNGMFRLSSRWYFLTENYYINIEDENVGMISLGSRWIIKKAALDFGLFFPVVDAGSFIGIPWLGMTVPFGNTN
ncbi:MAG TPA: hypothetical protein VKA10_00120 [Prolixibacteraceae bacterium]|nr:hypothetical protein [Prolixibacteraceae bacterium]